MNVQYSTKLIRHLLQKNHNHGFTIIELVVVIIVIGILSLIALPSFKIHDTKYSSQYEPFVYIGSINRRQEGYFIESNGKFFNSVSQLDIDIQEQTGKYSYSTIATTNSAFSYAIAKRDYIENGLFHKTPVYSFVGGVFVITAAKKSEITTVKIICMNDKPGTIIPNKPIFKNGIPSCGVGTYVPKIAGKGW